MSDESQTETAVGCVLSFALLPVQMLLRGWVLSTLWRWLIVPVFGLRPLTVLQAIGVSIVVGMFTAQVPPKDDEGALESLFRHTLFWLVGYAISLTVGYVISRNI